MSTMKRSILSIMLLMGTTALAEQPNIVLILTDDQGYADVGFNGSTDILTPRLDALAEAGTRFSSAYVVHPFCGPSRMALMAGRYPHKMGTPYNLPDVHKGLEEWNVKGVPTSETLISTVLQDAGYYTGAVGKWHLGAVNPEYHPNARGFDDYYGFLGGGHKYYPHQFATSKKNGANWRNEYLWPLEHNGEDVTVTEYLTDDLSNQAARFIKDASAMDKPFFLYLAYNAPHSPIDPKTEDYNLHSHIANEQRRKYAAMVHSIDRGVGQVVDTLKATGEYDNTLIVFLSDNGGVPNQGADNTPLKGRKGDTWEGGYRVPMIFHWPGVVPAGRTYHHPVSALDFYPTFSSLADASIPEGKELDGKDIWTSFLADSSARKGEMIYTIRHRLNWHDVGARRDQWKITRKGVVGDRQNPWGLYNIEDDISESKNLRDSYPEILDEMLSELEQWTETHKDTMPGWFWSKQEEEYWETWGMPRYWQTLNEDCTLVATAVLDEFKDGVISDFRLGQNYPNPFNPNTKISFELSQNARVSLDVFNLHGQHVTNLVSGSQSSGLYDIEWNGEDKLGRKAPSGVYVYRLRIDDTRRQEQLSRKMVLLK